MAEKQKTIPIYTLKSYTRELDETVEAALKQKAEVVTLDFNRLRDLAAKIIALLS